MCSSLVSQCWGAGGGGLEGGTLPKRYLKKWGRWSSELTWISLSLLSSNCNHMYFYFLQKKPWKDVNSIKIINAKTSIYYFFCLQLTGKQAVINLFGLVNGFLDTRLVKNISDDKKGAKLLIFSYLLFFSSVLFEMEKDLCKIMNFCYKLFNKTKQKDRSISFSKSECSHSKNVQAFLEAQIGTFSNSHFHWL